MRTWDPERLIAEGAFVRSLARALVDGGADADDLVQETWLRALVRPPRVGFTLRTWLAGLVRNVARERRRGDERRERHERAAVAVDPRPAPSVVDPSDPSELAARFELMRRVFRWLDELPAPQRIALLQRYLDDLDPVEIARRQGVPDATIRSRIQRGLEALRARLDAESGGERAGWVAMLAPWSGGAGAAAAAAPAAALATSGPVFGVAAAAIVLVAATVAVRTGWMEEDEPLDAARIDEPSLTSGALTPSPPSGIAEVEALPASPVAHASREAEAASRAVDALNATPTAPVPSAWKLEGRLRGLDPTLPWTGEFRVAPAGNSLVAGEQTLLRTAVDHEGRFELVLADSHSALAALGAVRGLRVEAVDPAYVDTEAFVETLDEHGRARPAPWTFEVELVTRPSARVHKRVVDPSGRPVPNANVHFEHWNDGEGGRIGATDSAGRFAVESIAIGERTLRIVPHDPSIEERGPGAAELPAFLPAAVAVALRAGVDLPVPDVVVAPSCEIAGVAVDAEGRVLAGAFVEASFAAPPSNLDAAFVHRRSTRSGDDGAFALAGLPPGTWKLRVLGESALPVHPVVVNDDWAGAVEVDAPCRDVEVISRLATVTVRLALDGQPIVGAPLWVRGTGPDGDSSNLGGRTDEHGDFHFLALHGCTYQLLVEHADVERATAPFVLPVEQAAPFVTLDLERRRPRPSLALDLIVPAGEPVGRAWFQVVPTDGRAPCPQEFAELVPEGDRFTLPELDPGRYLVHVRAGGGRFGCGGFFQEDCFEVELDRPEVVTRSLTLRPTGRLRLFARDTDGAGLRARCRITTPAGDPLNAGFVFETASSAVHSPSKTFADGPCFVVPPRPPGRYVVELSADGFAPRSIEVEIVRGETTDVLATLERR